MRNISLSTPLVKGNAWKYVKDCLDSAWVSSVGSYVDRFESAVATYVGRKYAVACVNGTAALHTSMKVLGLQANEEVILPDLTFASPAFAVKYIGAYPVFIDVNRDSWQMDVACLKDFLSNGCQYSRGKLINRKTKRIVRGILPVHLLGHSCDMDEIMRLAKQYGLWVIEDAAESLGASDQHGKVGHRADIACFSFNGNKIITCGGGGMILTDNKQWAKKAQYLTTQAKDDPLEYIHHEVGHNYRLTNVLAALGLAQMEHLEEFVEKKRTIAGRYEKGLTGIAGLTLLKEPPCTRSIFWLNTVLVDPKVYGRNARELLHLLAKQGVQTRPLWHPLSGLKPFKDCDAYHIKYSRLFYDQGLSLPSSTHLSRSDQDFVINLIKKAASKK